jgi:hypothetical protein
MPIRFGFPVNEKGVLVDREGHKIEDNTIVECSFDVETRRWDVMRTRYEKRTSIVYYENLSMEMISRLRIIFGHRFMFL